MSAANKGPNCPICHVPMDNRKMWHEKDDKFFCKNCNDELPNLQKTADARKAATPATAAPAGARTAQPATAAPAAQAGPIPIRITRRGSKEYDDVQYTGPFPVTVRQLFDIYAGRLDLGGQTTTMVNGMMANADTSLVGGEYVTFKDSAKERGF